MIKIDGKAIARKIVEELKKRPKPEKILAAVFVGRDEASAAFLRRKEAIAKELGVTFQLHQLNESISQEELEKKVAEISYNERVGGLIVQLPLPKKFDRDGVLAKINPKKDVDALTNQSSVEAPAVGVVQEILRHIAEFPECSKFKSLNSLNIAVVGRGLLVGQPIVRWLEDESLRFKSLKFKVADSKTENLEEFLADADLIITGVGKAGLIKPEWLKEGAGVIDFGFPPDLDQEQLVKCQMSNVKCPELGFYTPTPGGTGPILVAMLFRNFYELTAMARLRKTAGLAETEY